MSEWPDHLDKALDDALTSYSEAPANHGLEQRILVQVKERSRRARRMTVLAPIIGAAAVAACCLCWWVTPRGVIQTQQASKTEVVSKKSEPLEGRRIPLSNSGSVRMLAKRRPRSHKQRAEPKLLQFPTPSSVCSAEEKLLQLASYKAKHATQELSYLGTPVTPIQLPAVEIKPIE